MKLFEFIRNSVRRSAGSNSAFNTGKPLEIYYRNGEIVYDNIFDDYEVLILEQLTAASAGNKKIYMKCVNIDLYSRLILADILGGGEIGSAEYEQYKKITEQNLKNSYKNLKKTLGRNFDIQVVSAENFNKLNSSENKNADIFGKLNLTVRNSDNKYYDLSGYAYTYKGKKGVWLINA